MNPITLFEDEFKKWLNVKHAKAVCNGSFGLKAALNGVKIYPGREVITTPFTFPATANAIIQAGAIPVFVDIHPKEEDPYKCVTRDYEPNEYTIDVEQVKKAITIKTSAVLPVHLFGNPCEMKELEEVSDMGIKIIEDACQALGTRYRNKYLGTIGDVGVFSFYATKNLWTGGGMVVTNHDKIARRIDMFRNHGLDPNGHMQIMGQNGMMLWKSAFDGWQMLKLHKKAILSELGSYGPEDHRDIYGTLIYNQPWYQSHKRLWRKLDCPNAEKAVEYIRNLR